VAAEGSGASADPAMPSSKQLGSAGAASSSSRLQPGSTNRGAAGSPGVSSSPPLGATSAAAAGIDPLAALLAGRSSPVRSRVLTASVDQQLRRQQQRLRASGGLDAAAGLGCRGAAGEVWVLELGSKPSAASS
jgi:hypothetical protein